MPAAWLQRMVLDQDTAETLRNTLNSLTDAPQRSWCQTCWSVSACIFVRSCLPNAILWLHVLRVSYESFGFARRGPGGESDSHVNVAIISPRLYRSGRLSRCG